MTPMVMCVAVLTMRVMSRIGSGSGGTCRVVSCCVMLYRGSSRLVEQEGVCHSFV